MTLLVNLLLTNVFLLGLSFLALRYGNERGSRWIDSLNRALRFKIPRMARRFALLVCGQFLLDKAERLISFVVYERNPLTMILYMVLSVGGYIAFVLWGYPHLPNDTLTFPYHREVGFSIFCGSVFFFLNAASTNPGIITKANHSTMINLYPFDGHVFKKGVICRTCKAEKPARSKHCRLCDVELARFDHHCIWINQCVGLGNVRSFLLFLLFNNIMCLYGGYLGVGIFMDIIETENLGEAWFKDTNSGNRFRATPYYIFIYLMAKESILMYLTILCLVLGSFLIFFTWYHWVTLMRQGITTNEEDKLSRLPKKEKSIFQKTYSKGSWFANLKDLWTTPCPGLIAPYSSK